MQKVVYIIGAGFSAPLGLPLISNFYDKAYDMYFENPDKYSSFKDIFQSINDLSRIKNIFKSDLRNIEEVLSILEMSVRVSHGKIGKPEFQKFICDVINHDQPTINQNRKGYHQSNWYGECYRVTPNSEYYRYGYFVQALLNLEARLATGVGSSVNNHIQFGLHPFLCTLTLLLGAVRRTS